MATPGKGAGAAAPAPFRVPRRYSVHQSSSFSLAALAGAGARRGAAGAWLRAGRLGGRLALTGGGVRPAQRAAVRRRLGRGGRHRGPARAA